MKIEKAIDKVKMQWSRSINPEKTAPNKILTSTSMESWKPPVYRQSKRIVPDMEIAMQNRCICLGKDAPEIEPYKVLRTRLIERAKEGPHVLMITSLRPGEGKTLTSINLALTFAKTYNHTVLLVDCDLRQQKVHRYLNLKSDRGLVDHLMHGTDLKDLIIWPAIDQMTLISGGRTLAESAELLGSPRMKVFVEEIKARYADRFIILDAPPILAGADTLTMTPLVAGIVLVVESGKTSLKEIQEGLDLLPREKIVGFLLNKHRATNGSYYYYQANAG